MKLKKIASLMLAGIMAVSMLAGCKTATEPTDDSSSSEVVNVNGAASALNAALSRNKDVIAFENDDQLNKNVAAYFSLHPIAADTWNAKKYVVDDFDINDELKNAIGFNYQYEGWEAFKALATETKDDGSHDGKTTAWVSMYNTKVYSQDDALKTVGKAIDALDFVEDKSNAKDDGKMYEFSGDATVLEVESAKGAASVWVVVVTLTKDYVAK